MKKFDGCLLVSDIDGTLLENGYINPKNFEAIEEFTHLGGTFCIATGRCVPAIEHIVCNFKNLTHAIACNGAMIFDYTKNMPIFERCLFDEDKLFFKEFTEKVKDMGVEVYCGNDVYLANYSDACNQHCAYENLRPEIVDFDSIMHRKWNKAMCFYRDGFDESIIEESIANFSFKNADFAKAGFELNGVYFRGYEELPGGANKGTALKKLTEILGIEKGKTFAIGDYYNDIQLISTADISCCPSGSPQDIKNTVDFVACACKEGAVADFIEYLKKADV